MTIEEVKSQAKTITYDELARTPDKYYREIVVFGGKVVQAIESGQNLTLRIDVAPHVDISDPNWKVGGDIVYVDYRKNQPNEARILEDDKVKFWGRYAGILSYKAVLGQTIQVPRIVARLVEDQGHYVRPAPRIGGR
jgi:hypothetical protein